VLHAPSLSISHQPLHKEVTTAIRNAIIRGELKPGERLIEADLAERLGVSRAPLREALKQLVAEGLLVNVARRGTTVIALTEKDIREIYSLRTALETLAIELITPAITAVQLAQFEALVRQMRELAADHGMSAHVDLEMRFHELLCLISGHQRLHSAWSQMGGQLRAFFAAADPQYNDLEFVERHESLLAAIASHDAAHAVATLREHVANGADRVLAVMRASNRPREN
jgi:DNA-binding GntR family transcriptional regulator